MLSCTASPPYLPTVAGCKGVQLAIVPGYPDIPGAEYALNITFTPEVGGVLLPSGLGAPPPIFLEKGLNGLDLLLTIATVSGAPLLNETKVGGGPPMGGLACRGLLLQAADSESHLLWLAGAGRSQ